MPPLPGSSDQPLPAIRSSSASALITPAQLMESEHHVLAVVNQVLDRLGKAPVPAFASLFSGAVWYRNWTEFNHFGPHSSDRHLGQIFGGGGVEAVWPAGAGPKLFAYLKPRHVDSVTVLKAALAYGYRVLAFLPGFPAEIVDDLRRDRRIVISSLPYRLDSFPDDVEIGIWHSPTGAAARCLEKGMHMIFLPLHPEQQLASLAIQRAGFTAHVAGKRERWPDVFDTIRCWPRRRPETRWKSADIPEFATKLASI